MKENNGKDSDNRNDKKLLNEWKRDRASSCDMLNFYR